MWMRLLARYCGVIAGLVCILIVPLPMLSGQSDNASLEMPYIYYYSDILNSLIIERADGSDSRVLAQSFPHTTGSTFIEFAWSPSGQWVSWFYGLDNGPGNIRFTPMLMRVDGSEVYSFGDMPRNIIAMQWSPNTDILMIAEQVSPQSRVMKLVNMTDQTILGEVTFDETLSDFYDFWSFAWSENGSYVYTYTFNLNTYQYTYISLSITGAVRIEVLGEERDIQGVQTIRGTRILQMTEKLTYHAESRPQLVMRDIETEQEVGITTVHPDAEARAFWNNDLSYAGIVIEWYGRNHQVINHTYYLLDWQSGDVMHLSQIPPTTEQVDPNQVRFFDWYTWSVDGSYVAFMDEGRRLSVIDITTYTSYPIALEKITALYWSPEASDLYIQIEGTSPYESVTYRYRATTNTLEAFPTLTGRAYGWLNFSPDDRIVTRLPSEGLVNLIDHVSEQRLPSIHHSLAQTGMDTHGIVWHESGDWYMTGESIFYASGGGGFDAITLYSRDGTLRRELGGCHSTSTCAGFVPPRVIPHLQPGEAESVLTQPIMTLEHDYPIEAMAWSPDGTRLATFGLSRPDKQQSQISVWQIADESTLIQTYDLNLPLTYDYFAFYLSWTHANILTLETNGGLLVSFDMTTETLTTTATPSYRAFNYPFGSASSERAQLIAIGSMLRRIVLLDMESEAVIARLNWADDALAFNPNGTLLAAGGTQLVSIWDTTIYRRPPFGR
ncbi:MAG: WD40 repeat domain-containing protein [Chloroflexota bacterium]|nr:WD40 repeat domain-containing protein [Chloroflexota bacterium]